MYSVADGTASGQGQHPAEMTRQPKLYPFAPMSASLLVFPHPPVALRTTENPRP